MRKIVGSGICVVLAWWLKGYTGPLSTENELVIATAILWWIIIGCSIEFIFRLMTLPFSRKK